MHHEDYQNAPHFLKHRVANRVVHAIRHSNLGIRFLLKDPQTKTYHDVGDKIASDKTRRAFIKINANLKKNAAIATHSKTLASSSIQFDAVAIENFRTVRAYLASWYTPDAGIGIPDITVNHQLCANVIALQKKLGLSSPKDLVSSIYTALHLIANPDANQARLDYNSLQQSNIVLARQKGDDATKEEKAKVEKYDEGIKKKSAALSKIIHSVNTGEDVPDHVRKRVENYQSHYELRNQNLSRVRRLYTAGETLSDEDAKTRANSPNVKYQADIQRLFADTVRRAIPGSDLHNIQNYRISVNAWLDEINYHPPPEIDDFRMIKHQVPFLCHTSIIGPSNLELTPNARGKLEASLKAAFALKWIETIMEKGLVHLQKLEFKKEELNTSVYATPGFFRSLGFFLRHYRFDYPLREGLVLYVYGIYASNPAFQNFHQVRWGRNVIPQGCGLLCKLTGKVNADWCTKVEFGEIDLSNDMMGRKVIYTLIREDGNMSEPISKPMYWRYED